MKISQHGTCEMWQIIIVLICVRTCAATNNILFILTDDQDLLLQGLKPMTKTLKWIAKEGVIFENAFANTPLCCPSRSTILTGKYLHNTGVHNNSVEGNCSSQNWQQNQEPYTIASYLKIQGNYTTFYAGKYLNQYGSQLTGGIQHIPPGYDWWIGLKGNSKYYNYTLSVNGTKQSRTNDYLTDVIKEYGLSFLNNWNKQNPFFMMLAPPAPHSPFTPAPRHANAFPNAKALRTPNFNRATDLKHWLVKMQPSPLSGDLSILDKIQKGRLQTLLAVDEMVEELVLKLRELNVLDDTYIIFTSDNGYHIGQFTLPWDKRQPYETDIRVPFIMRGRDIPKKRILQMPISFVDIAPSILTLAEVPVPYDMDGKSFIEGIKIPINDSSKILIEYFGEFNTSSVQDGCPCSFDRSHLTECSTNSWCRCQDAQNNTYSCVVDISATNTFKFCQFKDDIEFIEAYNISLDPYEMNNIFALMSLREIQYYKNLLKKLTTCKGQNCKI